MRTFADNLKRARKRLGLTQAQMARRLGTSQENVSRWERGVHRITKGTAEKLKGWPK